MKKRAFTLIEILVVVSIIAITSLFGITSYFRFQDRQKVDDTAREVVAYLRTIQNHARQGDRGTGYCAAYGNDANAVKQSVENTLILRYWQTNVYSNRLLSFAYCDRAEEQKYMEEYKLPDKLFLYCGPTTKCTGGTIYFHSVFGNVSANGVVNNASAVTFNLMLGDPTHDIYYRFGVDRGTILEGKLCTPGCSPNNCWNNTCP